MSWADTAGTVVASVLASGGVVALINALANRRKVQVDAVGALSDTAIEQVKSALEQVGLARREAEDARRSATQAWAEASEARREAMAVGAQLRRLTTEILSPAATIEQLRRMVADPGGGQNGHYVRR